MEPNDEEKTEKISLDLLLFRKAIEQSSNAHVLAEYKEGKVKILHRKF